MLPSPKTEEDVRAADGPTIAEMIRHEVDHVTHGLSRRLHAAEDYLQDHALNAQYNAKMASRRAVSAVRANPLPTGLLALGVGLILAAIVVPKRHA